MERKQRRRQILEAARSVFAARGFHQSSVADIIEEAGIARGTFYLYFESKRAIFGELVDQFLVAMKNNVRRVEIGAHLPPPYEQLRANFSRAVALFLEDRDMSVILLNHAQGLDEDSDRKLQEFYDAMALALQRAVEGGQALGLVSIEDTEIAARVMLGGIKEVIHYLVVQDAEPREREQLVDDLVQLIFCGVIDGGLKQLREPVSRVPDSIAHLERGGT
ncbi:MAG: TetR/AcrR family transcriptional regulator [Acidobacteriota bacterium]|nr:MAG: TetR/AcrR family transcriptional regulator [Acidobacteriota bacterium]